MFSYKNLSIKKLTLIIFTCLYLIFLLVTTFNLYSYSKYEFNKTEKLIKNFNISFSNQIEEKINTISDVSKYPLLIPEISTLHQTLRDTENFQISHYNYLKYLCEMMLIQNNYISGAYIYDLKGMGAFASRNSSHYKLINPLNENWFQESLSSSSATSIFANINSSSIFDIDYSKGKNLILLTRKIIDINTNQITGMLLVTLSTEEFNNILNYDLPFNNEAISIYSSSGDLILSTNKEESEFNYFDKVNFNSSEPSINYIYEDAPYVICSNPVNISNWIVINKIPKKDAFKLDNLYIIFLITNILFFLISSIILYLFFTKRIFNPIQYLINNMSSNSIENNLNKNFRYDKDDEIGKLVNSYNDMKGRINSLININYKNQIEQKELELRQLQNQINPHFIYNTLESIHMMAEINDDLETSTMAEYFGSIIRYSMNRKINTVKLNQEMEIIDNYIYLQKIRFDQLFTIENIIPEELLNCEIIKMIIQPLIENAIYHGLSKCDSNGKIIIQGHHIDNNLLLTISDNGIGIEDENLKDLNDYINDKNNKFSSIALRNINRRLKLNYGKDYGLEIFSVYGKGTSMVLTLPYIIK
ncbi:MULTISPECIES: sensor histidine kinase [unclassified Clostridium]|uniref:sensor histidine kinase n=1 Tax=unclassified Clostridium TaxID=2614128 RepID=UPI001896D3B7|nr:MULTISPECIES: sensor histidine kinase [unclassified Clostridium]MCR1951123.1 histidine kinase [Clostridium sp. DSM 100503]